MPPPTNCGARVEPCRARPAPFWPYGFLPPPPPPPAAVATGLRRVRALSGGRELGDDDLVDQRDVDLDVEDVLGQVDGAAGGAVDALDLDAQRRRRSRGGGHLATPPFPRLFLTAVRRSTTPPAGPGTAP